MEKKELETSKLFVISPSIVIDDTTNHKDNITKNISSLNHIVHFETRPSDITVVLKQKNNYVGIVDNTRYQSNIGLHCTEGDLYVGVRPNDSILLARYLWIKNINMLKYWKKIEKYIISLKPFYTIEEIKEIVEQIKLDMLKNKETEKFVYQKKRQQPIYKPNVYTDID